MTLPMAVTPQGLPHESSTFLLPYSEGQVEALLQTPMAQANKSKRSGFRLTSGTTRDHEHVSSLQVELLAKECPLAGGTVRKIWAGPGGIAPLAWCVAHKITDPLSHLQVRMYYWHHFGVAITHPTDSVHAGSIYYRSYLFWSAAQTNQFIEGVAVTPDSSSQHLGEPPAAAAAEAPREEVSPMEEEEPKPEATGPGTGSPLHSESVLPEIAEDESEDEDWSGWLSPGQAELLQADISSHKEELSTLNTQLKQRASSLSISQEMIDDLKATNARLGQQLVERVNGLKEVHQKLAEEERNEKHAVAKIATATAQAKAAALAKYAPLVALSRTIAIAAGHIIEGSLMHIQWTSGERELNGPAEKDRVKKSKQTKSMQKRLKKHQA